MHPETDPVLFQKQCEQADTYSELVGLAKAELNKFPEGCRIEMVCGPISTGGYGNVVDNLRVFNATVNGQLRRGQPVFNQIPYEGQLSFFYQRWLKEDPARASQYCMAILNQFYLPLFATRMIKVARFIPRWQSSFGSRWEWKMLFEYGAEIHYLTEKEIGQFLHQR